VRVTGDIDTAEECVQDAYAQALTTWAQRGVPNSPAAWLTTVARRRALDSMRRATTLRAKLPLLAEPEPDAVDDDDPTGEYPDDRLRLIFTCCHPALASEAQVALTLRLMCGLSTAEVARAFLVSESTMAARITRAKKKISVAGIPYRVPGSADLPERVESVLAVVHLLFTTGHTAPAGADLVRRDLTERAKDLARMLHLLLPRDAEVAGLLALILLSDARRATRVDENGRLVRLAEQDRSRWDSAEIAEALAMLESIATDVSPGRHTLQAAIAAVHARAQTWEHTDWRRIVMLYDQLVQVWPSPVVELNRAVAVGLADGPAAGLRALEVLGLEPQLAGYPYLAAARAEFLGELGRRGEARDAYDEALMLTENAVERRFLTDQREAL
jgi:RNA polymerase sigma factor (sigma-70 family)